MKTELTNEDIGKLLQYASDHPKLYNDINRIIYRDFDIINPPVCTLLMIWALGELQFKPECKYFRAGDGYCMAQKGAPRVCCGGKNEKCEK